jgi:hypothetical protein
MTKVQDRFWNWATGSFVRFGTVLVVAHAVVSAPLKRRSRNHG